MAVVVVAEAFADFSPCPRVVLTITGLGTSESVVSVWRVAEGGRASVRGARRLRLTDSGFVTDFDAPFGRTVSYEVEVISGPDGASRTQSNTVTVDSAEACISDPLMPQKSVAVGRPRGPLGKAVLSVSALRSFDYKAEVSSFQIMGSSVPMVLTGGRQQASSVDLSLLTGSRVESERVRELFMAAGQVLVRFPLSWQESFPGAGFVVVASVVENPLGDDAVLWALSGDVVSAPTLKPLSGGLTFGDVQMLYSTFEAKHVSVVAAASAAGEQPTFLFDLMHPLG